MPCWEYKRNGSLNKSPLVRYGARGPTTPGTRYEYDQKKDDEFETFEAHGMDWTTDVVPLLTTAKLLLDQQTPITITDRDGHHWTGKIYGLEWKAIGQGVVLFDVVLKFKNPTYVA